MVNWFGPESWGAPICTDAPRCDIPVGVECERCKKKITEASSGVTMPMLGRKITEAELVQIGVTTYHLDCHLKGILPHTMWPAAGLVPEECDGLVDGRLDCPTCGMYYTTFGGWVRRLK